MNDGYRTRGSVVSLDGSGSRLVRWVPVVGNRLVVAGAIVAVAVGVIPLPIALFTASVLRTAAIGRRTVAVGSFVPPRGS